MRIAVDIGHARGTGARGMYEGKQVEEHAICEVIAPALRGHLEAMGHTVDVIDFPGKSNGADLEATIAAANAGGYDFGISLHCDCAPNSATAHGAHVCYVSQKGKRLAACIARYLCNLMPGRAEGVQERPKLAVLMRTRPVWCLVECGFITNKVDRAMLLNAPGSIARAIARGVKDFIEEDC